MLVGFTVLPFFVGGLFSLPDELFGASGVGVGGLSFVPETESDTPSFVGITFTSLLAFRLPVSLFTIYIVNKILEERRRTTVLTLAS